VSSWHILRNAIHMSFLMSRTDDSCYFW